MKLPSSLFLGLLSHTLGRLIHHWMSKALLTNVWTSSNELSLSGGTREEDQRSGSYNATPDVQDDVIVVSSDEDAEDVEDVKGPELSAPSPPSAKHWSFNDYFHADYNEKPILQQMRDTVERTKSRYRNCCKEADKARVDLNYANSPGKRESLEETLRLRVDTRESYKTVKALREANLKAHERLAKECMRLRKKQDKDEKTALRKEAAMLNKIRQSQARRAKKTASSFGSFRVKKPRVAKRTSWYAGADSGDESEGEWREDNNWKP